MMRGHPIYQLTVCRVREFLREPEAVFWVFLFPLLLALALGIAFRSRGPGELAVGVQRGEGAAAAQATLDEAEGLRAEILDVAEAERALRAGRVALVVIPDGGGFTYWFDPMREESRLARLSVDDALQRAAGRADTRPVGTREITETGSRYIDFLIPGLLGMNLMGTGVWGIGFYVVQARSRKLLRRMVAAPMRRWHFLLAQMLGRLVFLVLEVGLVLGFARVAFGVPVRGSWVLLALTALLGALTFAGIGLLVASRSRTIEGVSGWMNLVMAPMWIFSGIFFSTARFPAWMQPAVQFLPLTAVNDALRAVMLDGAGVGSIAGELGIAGAWGAVAFAVALVVFRWK